MTPLEVIFLDLDDTLYPKTNGLWKAISLRILSYLTERLGLPSGEAERLRTVYLENYGTTLGGLVRHHGVDPLEYLRYVHDLHLGDYLQPDPRLGDLLDRLQARRVILTNAHREHAEGVLDRLDISDRVEQIIDIVSLRFRNKPNPEAYHTALDLCGQPPPTHCAMVDDRARNLEPAARLGMRTILVAGNGAVETWAQMIPSIYELPRALSHFA